MKLKQHDGVKHPSNDIDGKCLTQHKASKNVTGGIQKDDADSITDSYEHPQYLDIDHKTNRGSAYCSSGYADYDGGTCQWSNGRNDDASAFYSSEYYSESPAGGAPFSVNPDENHPSLPELSAPVAIINHEQSFEWRVDVEYLGKKIHQSCMKSRLVVVRSEKGTGKTTAIKEVIGSLADVVPILVVTPRKKLNFAFAKEIGFHYYEDVKKETDPEKQKQMAMRMVVTPQSLGALIKKFPDIVYRYIVIDESETVASMLVSKATEDKTGALLAIKTAAKKSGNIVAMDAAAGVRTDAFMRILGGSEPIGLLENSYKRWANITATILTGGKYSDRVEASDAMQITAIMAGRKIGISSGSAAYCQTRFNVLSALFPDLKIGLFTSKSSAETRRILGKPELVTEYDVIIFSPAISIGVSFDAKDHFHEMFGVYPNCSRTADSDDANQGMARLRHLIDDRWTIVLDDDKQVYNRAVTLDVPADVAQILIDRILRESFAAGFPVDLTNEDHEIALLWAVCSDYHIENKNNFSQCFKATLSRSGAVIEYQAINLIEQSADSVELTEISKETQVQQKIAAKTTSQKIDEKQNWMLEYEVKHRSEGVTQDQLDSMERFRFERRFDIDCDKLQPADIERYLRLDDENAIQKCINREILQSDADFDKQYIKARIKGIGDVEAFKVDLLDDKLGYRLNKKLLRYAVDCAASGEYSHDSLRRSGLFQFVERNLKEIVATEAIPLPKDWRKKPALVMNHLLDMVGYDHASRQKSENGKRKYIYSASPNPEIDDLCESRVERGAGWVTGTKRLLGIYEEVQKQPENVTRIQRLWAESGRRDDIEAFMIEFKDDIDLINSGEWDDKTMLYVIGNFGY